MKVYIVKEWDDISVGSQVFPSHIEAMYAKYEDAVNYASSVAETAGFTRLGDVWYDANGAAAMIEIESYEVIE